MELTLNIYKDGKEVEKTYKASEFDLMWGTIEDLISIIDIDKLEDEAELAKMFFGVLPQVKPLLKEIFPGLTDSEIRKTKAKELVPVFISSLKYAFYEIGRIENKSGN
jgi:hypothetical protein